jgi:hypothetical protein
MNKIDKDKIADTILSERKNTLHNIGGIAIDMLMFIDKNRDSLIKYIKSTGNNTPYTEIEATVNYLNSLIGINSTEINSAVYSIIRDDYNNKCRYSDEHYGQHCTTLCANKIRAFRDKMGGMIEYHKGLLDTLDTEYLGFILLNKWRMDIEIELIDHICDMLSKAIWEI